MNRSAYKLYQNLVKRPGDMSVTKYPDSPGPRVTTSKELRGIHVSINQPVDIHGIKPRSNGR